MSSNETNGNHRSADKKRLLIRRGLMTAGVVVVAAICTGFYFYSGRFISTDNAYVKTAKILVTPQVAGTVVAVAVKDNQVVQAGDVLFAIDPADYQIAVAEAEADLAKARTDIEMLKVQYRQKKETLATAQVDATFTEEEFRRRSELLKKGLVSQSEFDEIKRQRDSTQKNLAVLQEDIKGIVVALEGNPAIKPEDHPLFQKELAALKQAQLNLQRTTVLAPATGIVGSAPNVGDYARASIPMLNLVGTDHVWIEANYKETELTDVKVGQTVTIKIDTYPGREWSGRVESISPATGSEFSILPAQNATGNWVKVVQRISVRIAIDLENLDPGNVKLENIDPKNVAAQTTKSAATELQLRAGMSAHVTIDIGRYPHLAHTS